MDPLSQIWQVALALVFIVGLVVALGLLAKRVQGLRGVSGESLQILSSTALGPKEKLVLVQVEGTRLLVGVNQQSITKLLELAEPAIDFSDCLDEAVQESVAEKQAPVQEYRAP